MWQSSTFNQAPSTTIQRTLSVNPQLPPHPPRPPSLSPSQASLLNQVKSQIISNFFDKQVKSGLRLSCLPRRMLKKMIEIKELMVLTVNAAKDDTQSEYMPTNQPFPNSTIPQFKQLSLKRCKLKSLGYWYEYDLSCILDIWNYLNPREQLQWTFI